jgi:predicted nucleotidyltransferase
MILTKTQLRIMQLFTGRITETFSIRQVERELNRDYSLVHRAIKPLIDKYKLLKETENARVILNFREHHNILSYVEYLRRDSLLSKPKHKDLAMCLEAFIKKFKEESFVLLLFGSAVNKNNPRDIDILLIVDSMKKTESSEAFLHNVSRDYELDEKLHIVCITYESVYEMLGKREQRNVLNEVLNKHIIIHGAELFYRLLDRGRK